jgi:hypothetical protein
MIKVDVNANNWNGLDQPAGSTGGNGLESKPTRPSPFPNFHGWGSGAATKAPKPVPAAPTPAVARKAIDTGQPLGCLQKYSDAMMAHVSLGAAANRRHSEQGSRRRRLGELTTAIVHDWLEVSPYANQQS